MWNSNVKIDFAAIKQHVPLSVKKRLRRAASAFYRFRWREAMLPSVNFQEIVGREPPQVLSPLIHDGICMPPFSGGTHKDLHTLIGIAEWLQPQLILELGTAFGNTVANLAARLPDARIYTVNAPVEEQTGSNVTFRLAREEIGRVYKENGYGSRVMQIFENTLRLELGNFLTRNSIDLAIIDACHDIDYVLNDFRKVEPFMSPGGIVLLHDTHPSMRGHLSGSYRACVLLRKDGYDLRHIAGTWWGIYRKR